LHGLLSNKNIRIPTKNKVWGPPLPPHYAIFGRKRGVFWKVVKGFQNLADRQACADVEREPPSARAEFLQYWEAISLSFSLLAYIWPQYFLAATAAQEGHLSVRPCVRTLDRFFELRTIGKEERVMRVMGLRFGPKAGSHGWVPWLGPVVGSQGWVPRLGPKVGSQGLVPLLVPMIGSNGWAPRLGPKVGSLARSQGWVPRFCSNVRSHVWVPLLSPMVGSHGWVPRLGQMAGSHDWVPRLGPKVGSQDWVPRLGPKVGSQGWVPRLVPKVGSQGWVPRLGPKVGSQGWVPKSQLPSPNEGLGYLSKI
jgi:hypothetical protein